MEANREQGTGNRGKGLGRRAALLLLVFAFCLLPFAFSQAQEQGNGAGYSYQYKFENARFYIPLIEIALTAEGAGEVRFKRGESDEIIDLKVKLEPATLARIARLFHDTRFLESAEEYQGKKDFSHLGWVTLSAQAGERKRTARFNHTENMQIKELADIFRAVATQEIHLFDIDLAEQYQPLDLPRQVEALENDLRLERIAEPARLLPALREIEGNNTLPLISRNKARKIIQDIEKGKYKSPVKADK
ncbi:MAG TPA: hypothetical protein VNO70_15315 [Blastocatellia bacterium]|nr:hypothetical protein [Blastocatellia bacterium]